MKSRLNSLLFLLLLAFLSPDSSRADAPTRQLVYDIAVAGRPVGTRTATITTDSRGGADERVIESFTDIDGMVGPVRFSYKQRLTAFAGEGPASFHAVISENGDAREVQGQWSPAGWTVTLVGGGRARTWQAPPHRIDISTIDLVDPGNRRPLPRFDSVRVLSTETGDVWEGDVEPLGPSEVEIGGRKVPVDGVSWLSPEGRVSFYYDAEGWLVRYETRIMGIKVSSTLRQPPPPGPDEFPVRIGLARVDVIDL